VRIGGDQLDPGQAAGGQVSEEPQPAGTVLAGGDLEAEDLSRTLRTSASAATHVNGPASASGRVRNCSTCSSSSAAITETCDFDNLVIPRVSTSFSIRRVETPNR